MLYPYRSDITLRQIVDESKSPVLKSAYKRLSSSERAKLTEALREFNRNRTGKMQDEINELKSESRILEAIKEDHELYRGFYNTLNNKELSPLLRGSMSIEAQYINGIKEAVDYLKTTPTQVIQHYGDPNPKEKITRYYHHKDKV